MLKMDGNRRRISRFNPLDLNHSSRSKSSSSETENGEKISFRNVPFPDDRFVKYRGFVKRGERQIKKGEILRMRVEFFSQQSFRVERDR